MRKILIYLVLCTLGFCSVGQGTAFITKSNVLGYTQLIRQWENLPGHHVIHFIDAASRKNYIGITDVFNYTTYVQVTDNGTIHDVAVLDDMAYFCGETATGKVLLGWVSLSDLYGSGTTASLYVDTDMFVGSSSGIYSLENIEVYYDVLNQPRIVGYGKCPSGYVALEYVITFTPPYTYTWGFLPYVPYDMTLTNQFIVFAGILPSNDLVLHPFMKNVTLDIGYAPYYPYTVSSATAVEPYDYLRIVGIGHDSVSTVAYRLDGGVYGMTLRTFDVTNAFVSYQFPMLTSYQSVFPYRADAIKDFRYNAAQRVYTVLQNYEVAPSDYHDVVTRIDFSGGIPSIVQSDYLTIADQKMMGMSLSDSSRYVVYGYDVWSTASVFWKDFVAVSGMGPCLNTAILPFNGAISSPFNLHAGYYSNGTTSRIGPVPNTAIKIREIITTICH
jgi:hypothetical protein